MKNNKKSAILILLSIFLLNVNYQYQFNNMKENLNLDINRITVFSYMQSNTIESLEYYNSLSSILTLNVLYVSLIISSIINHKDYVLNRNDNRYRFLFDLSFLLSFINETDSHSYTTVNNSYNSYAHGFWNLFIVFNGIMEKRNYNINYKRIDVFIGLFFIVSQFLNTNNQKKRIQRLFLIQWLFCINLITSRYYSLQ